MIGKRQKSYSKNSFPRIKCVEKVYCNVQKRGLWVDHANYCFIEFCAEVVTFHLFTSVQIQDLSTGKSEMKHKQLINDNRKDVSN